MNLQSLSCKFLMGIDPFVSTGSLNSAVSSGPLKKTNCAIEVKFMLIKTIDLKASLRIRQETK